MTYHDNVSGNLSTNYNGLGKNGIFNGSGIPFREERASLSVFLMAAIIPCSKVGKMRSPEAEYSHQSWRISVPPPKQWLQYFQRKSRMDFGF
jgi:hypothetical protein